MSAMQPDKNKHKKTKDEPFGDLVKSVNSFFNEKPVRGFLQTIDDFFKNPFPPGPSFHVDTVETNNEIIVSAELPGIKREQIQLDVLGNYLTISIENCEEEFEEDEVNQVYKRSQFREHSSRTIVLSHPINEKNIKASYRDGLLKIRIPQEKGKSISIEE
ncbi:MAG: Hsp20/alpha crystallin family protein [Bacillota bacterium]|nr:Hsp20/alpha crystallin family protein [Bacillota bacterium]